MTTLRMFAFAAAVLITAFLLRVFAYGLTAPQHAAAVRTSASSQSSAD
jgi:hypothetical protein